MFGLLVRHSFRIKSSTCQLDTSIKQTTPQEERTIVQLQFSMDDNTFKAPEGCDQEAIHTRLDALENSRAILRDLARSQELSQANWNPDSPATKKVLQIAELLQNILLYIPTRELLLNCLRVSKFWNETISESPSLQQNLHFRPMPKEKQHFQDGKPMYSVCGLLTHKLAEYQSKFQEPFVLDYDANHTRSFDIQLSKLHWIEAFSRQEASWRKMLVVQPPVPFAHNFYDNLLHFEEVQLGMDHPEEKIVSVVRYQGHERLGEIYDFWKKKDWTEGKNKKVKWYTPGNHLWMEDTTISLVDISQPTKGEQGFEFKLSFNSWKHGSEWKYYI